MISKKSIVAVIVMVMVMVLALTACSSDNGKKANVPPQESHTVDSTINDEEMSKSENQSDISDVSTDSSHIETVTDANVPTSKPSQNPIESPSKPTGGSASKPNNPGDNGSGSSSSNPTPHIHSWEKQPKGNTFDWGNSCGPDENGYTTNREIAKNKNGKTIGIYMCAICYKYYGSPDNGEWEARYHDHIYKPGPCCGAGYCTYDVYAVFDAFHCKECDAWKRGNIAFYGYYDYSNGAKWIYLEPWQIKELNLEMP